MFIWVVGCDHGTSVNALLLELGRCQGRAACAGNAGTTVNFIPSSVVMDDRWSAEVDTRAVEPRG